MLGHHEGLQLPIDKIILQLFCELLIGKQPSQESEDLHLEQEIDVLGVDPCYDLIQVHSDLVPQLDVAVFQEG